MTTFFTSDTHFGHTAIITHSFRPFATVEDMDETLIRNWNRHVQPGDTVYHLGDFTMRDAEVAEAYRRRLNGKIHLIWGNHDRNSVRRLPIWASSQYATELNLDGYKLTLCHYAMRVWHNCHRGALMLHGHSHNNLPGSSQSLDVGVDAWEYKPVTLADILKKMTVLPKFSAEDHHR